MLKNVFGLIYAGEQNIRLVELIQKRSVGALPIGGRYRAIDFVLSNMVNSGIRSIGVIAQKNYHSLMDHLGAGKEWDLSRKNDGLFIIPPFDTSENSGAHRGICDAIRNSKDFLHRTAQQYCLLTGSYTIYNSTYNDLLHMHMENNADVSMLYNVEDQTTDLPEQRFKDVRLYIDDSGRVTDLEMDPTIVRSRNVGMDCYLIRKDLMEYLVDDALSRGKYNFVEDVLIPNLSKLRVFAMRHDGYVGRLSSVSSYFNINRAMLQPSVQHDLFYTGNTVYTKVKDEVPAKYGSDAKVYNSLVANGCIIEGSVYNSVLSRGVYVGRGSVIMDSIVMQDSEIYQNCTLENVILDKKVYIRSGRRLIGDEHYPVIIQKGAIV